MGFKDKFLKRAVAQKSDYEKTFNTDHGRRVLHDLMRAGHLLGTTFRPESPQMTAFQEGERNMVLRILTIMKTDFEKLEKEIEREGEDADRTY